MMDRTLFLLERIGSVLRGLLADAARAHGLQPVHAHILFYLARANRYSDGTAGVADYLGLTRGTVSTSLALLEARGLIGRRGDAADRRRVRFALTDEGARIAQRIAAALPGTTLPDDRAAKGPDALAATLESILRSLQKAGGLRPFGLCAECALFRPDAPGTRSGRCGLTGERLTADDSERLCRDWRPGGANAA